MVLRPQGCMLVCKTLQLLLQVVVYLEFSQQFQDVLNVVRCKQLV